MNICGAVSLGSISRRKNGLILLFFALSAVSANAQLIECIDSRGNSRYSEIPCGPNERDPRKITRRSGGERNALSHDAYSQAQTEQARQEKERETAARAQEEQQRERELIRIDQLMRYEAANAVYNKRRVEKESGKAGK